MKLKYDVYLSVKMHGRLGREVIEQAQQAKDLCTKFGLKAYSPTEDENINPSRIIDKKPSKKLMKWYVNKDDRAVDRSKSLLLLTGDTSSAGTGWECGRMFYKNHRPIVVVAPRMYDGSLVNFTTIKADRIFATQKQAISYLKRRIK